MTIDTDEILSRVNLADLIAQVAEPTRTNKRFFCPFCQPGGAAHNNSPALSVTGQLFHCHGCSASGTAIDFVMQRDNVTFREACVTLGWDGTEPDPAEAMRRAIEAEKRREETDRRRAAELDALLREYTAEEIWQAYSRRMTDEHKLWWIDNGVPVDWQEYLRLGFVPDKVYRTHDGRLLHSPAYTIPYFHTKFEFRTLQYRLNNPDRPKDRYRFEHGLRADYYQTDPMKEIGDYAIICEGAKKGIVANIYGDTGVEVSVMAIPAKESFAGVVEAVKHCKKVWICLDPDCWTKPENAPDGWLPAPVKLARRIGKMAAIVNLPGKVDDMILENSMTGKEWKDALKQAWRTK